MTAGRGLGGLVRLWFLSGEGGGAVGGLPAPRCPSSLLMVRGLALCSVCLLRWVGVDVVLAAVEGVDQFVVAPSFSAGPVLVCVSDTAGLRFWDLDALCVICMGL